jgi:hypothetical protein
VGCARLSESDFRTREAEDLPSQFCEGCLSNKKGAVGVAGIACDRVVLTSHILFNHPALPEGAA